jgi:hypothetical protein
VVAKEFSRRPSDYITGLGAYEAFCVDELCAHSLMQLREKAQKDAEARAKGQRPAEPEQRGPVSLEWLEEYQNKRKARGT